MRIFERRERRVELLQAALLRAQRFDAARAHAFERQERGIVISGLRSTLSRRRVWRAWGALGHRTATAHCPTGFISILRALWVRGRAYVDIKSMGNDTGKSIYIYREKIAAPTFG